MLRALLRFSIERRGVVLLAALALVAWGVYRLSGAGLDIFPEFAPQLVVVQTEAPGYTAEQVETRVTQPLETALGGVIGIDYLSSESIQGLSVITLVFEEGSDTWRNRSQVSERLQSVLTLLPRDVDEPVIAPLASSSATVRTLGLTLAGDEPLRLRDLATTLVVPRLLALPGVLDVNVFGGAQRALLVEPDPQALARYAISRAELERALAAATANPPLGVVETVNQAFALSAGDGALDPLLLGRAVVRDDAGRAITVADLGRVRWGALPRISAAQIKGRPALVMMVIGQLGANTLTVSQQLDRALADLEPVLNAAGVTLHARLFVPANYITTALADIARHLLIGGVLVLAVLVIGLYDLRAALISALAIPLSLLAAAIVLIEFGVNLNVLVIGGLAIALGEVVDDAIIDTENIARRLREAPPAQPRAVVALAASLEVRGAVVYATFIVALVFVPLLTLGGVSGRLFAPLGLAYILAVLASLGVAMTVTPALCVSLLARRGGARREAPFFRAINPGYCAAVRALAGAPALAVAAAVVSTLAVVLLVPGLGARFLPDLREGHFIVHTTALPGTSLDESLRMGQRLSTAFSAIPGVRSVSQWAGRAERGADTYGSHYSEYEIALEPLSGTRQQAVLDALRATLANYPGISYEANTFLTERIDETISGYAAPLVINLYGPDLDQLDTTAAAIAALASDIPGARNVRLRASHLTPQLHIALDPERLARHGLNARQVLDAVRSAYAGAPLAAFHEHNRRVPIALAPVSAERASPAALGQLVIDPRGGVPLHLADVADLGQSAGRYNILHRNGQRLQVITCDVAADRAADFLRTLRQRVADEIELPPGTHPEYTGAAVEGASARTELVVHALGAGVGVLILIYLAVGRARHLVLILLNLPFALLGGVIAVLLGGGVVSVGSVVGFVTLFGITVRNAIMLVSHYEHLVVSEGARWDLETVVRGARERLPAILMTALVTALAMLPLTIDSDNAGREIMGPMAAIIVGGLLSSTLLNLLLMPALLLRYGDFSRAPQAAM